MAKERNYWRERFKLLEQSQHERSLFYYAEIERAYAQALRDIESDILRWYNRFAKSEGISLDEAKKLLKADELAEFKWNVNDYIAYGKRNAINQAWMKQLENASSRVHVSRLESLRIQLQQHVERLFGERIESFEQFLKEVYQDQYYQTIFELQKGFEVGFSFQTLDDVALTAILSKPWTADDLTFSHKVWRDREILIDTLQKELSQSVALGESPQRMITVVEKKLDTSRSSAARLVQTEQSFFSAVASKNAYKELNVKMYEIVATLDSRTSEICQTMDGKVFKLTDYEPGITANPFHPRCRTTTAPFFEDDYGLRIARNKQGQTYHVSGKIKYPEWKGKFVG